MPAASPVRTGGSPCSTAAARSATAMLATAADKTHEHRLVADRLHDPSAVLGDGVVHHLLPPGDELAEPIGVELGAERRVPGEVGEPDRDEEIRRRVAGEAKPQRGAEMDRGRVHDERGQLFGVERLHERCRDLFVGDTLRALLLDDLAVVLGDHRRDARHRRADDANLAQQGCEVGSVREPAPEQPACGLDVGVGEHRQTFGHVGKSDCAPQASQLIFVVPGYRGHVGDVVGRTARSTNRSSVSSGNQPSRSARSTSSSEAPAASRRFADRLARPALFRVRAGSARRVLR